jgi:hypothetical protein
MELLYLLGIIERIILVSGEEWDQVKMHHSILYPVRKAEGFAAQVPRTKGSIGKSVLSGLTL